MRWKREVGEANAVEKAQAAKRIEVQDEGIMAAKKMCRGEKSRLGSYFGSRIAELQIGIFQGRYMELLVPSSRSKGALCPKKDVYQVGRSSRLL